MVLENLTIRRVCLHEVYRRTDERSIRPSVHATNLLELSAAARGAFERRLVAAFASDAKCMDMVIRRVDEASIAARGAAIVGAEDAEFISKSGAFADQLAEAQNSRQIPGGVVAVFDGSAFYPPKPFFGVMKAELHDGFVKRQNLQAIYDSNIFLGPKTRLYKVGLFISGSAENPTFPADWSAKVFDAQLTAQNRDNAASYFHSVYLGLSIPEDSAQQTRKFFQKTKEFIAAAQISQEQKVDLYNGLYTYLKVDQSSIVQVSSFAESIIPVALRGDYRNHMRRERVPDTAIVKDLSEVAGTLRLRKFRFPNRITLSGPPEAISQLVSLEAIAGDEEGARWTRVTIRGPIEGQQ